MIICNNCLFPCFLNLSNAGNPECVRLLLIVQNKFYALQVCREVEERATEFPGGQGKNGYTILEGACMRKDYLYIEETNLN